MTEHFCQYKIKWAATQDDVISIKCDQLAPIHHTYMGLNGMTGMWLCSKHYDLIQQNLAAVGLPHD